MRMACYHTHTTSCSAVWRLEIVTRPSPVRSPLGDPSYVDALVAAADEIGVGVCISVASLDRESAAVLDFREVHVSGSSNSSSSGGGSDGGSGINGSSSSGAAGNGTAPGADDGTVDIAAGGNGTLPQLPAGKVLTAWSVGPSGQCAAYNESSGKWHNAALFPFGESGVRRCLFRSASSSFCLFGAVELVWLQSSHGCASGLATLFGRCTGLTELGSLRAACRLPLACRR